MKGIEFVFDSLDLLYCKLHLISLNRGRSYIDSTKWLKNKKATINPKNNDDECFQYAITVSLNHEEINKDLQRTSKINSFINKYNWKEINFPSHKNGKSLKQIIKRLLLSFCTYHKSRQK